MEFKSPKNNQNNDFDNEWNNPKREKPHDPNDLTDPRNAPNSYFYDPYLNNHSTPIQPKKTPPNSDAHNLSPNNQPPQPESDTDSKTNPFKVSPEKLAENVGSAHDIEEQQANEPLDKTTTGKDTPSASVPDNRADLGLPTSGGKPLPKETKDKFQPKLKGQNLDDVELISAPDHVNYVGAESFKLGKTIYTKDNNPASHILDHEVKHVVDAKTGKDRAPNKIRRWAKNDNWLAIQEAARQRRIAEAAERERRRIAAEKAAELSRKRREALAAARKKRQADVIAARLKDPVKSKEKPKKEPYKKLDLTEYKAKLLRQQAEKKKLKLEQKLEKQHPGIKAILNSPLLAPGALALLGTGFASPLLGASILNGAKAFAKLSSKQDSKAHETGGFFGGALKFGKTLMSGAASFGKDALKTGESTIKKVVPAITLANPALLATSLINGSEAIASKQENNKFFGGALKFGQDLRSGAMGLGEKVLKNNPLAIASPGLLVTSMVTSPEAKQFTEAIPGWIDKQVDNSLKRRSEIINASLKPLEHIPVVGKAAHAFAWFDNKMSEFGGGVLKGAGSLVGGIANMVTHPVETASGIYAMAEHVPLMGGLIPNPFKLAHAGVDVMFNGADPKTRLERVFDPGKSLEDDAKFGKALVNGFIEPYKKSWSEGKYFEILGRGAFDVGSALLGPGQINAALKGGSAAGKVAKVTNVVSKADKATEVGGLADKAADAGNLAKSGDEVAKVEQVEGTLSAKQSKTETLDTISDEFSPASSREHKIRSADVQPRHFTKLEHALRFRQVGQPKRAANLLRELKADLGPERYEMLRNQHLEDLDKGSALRGNALKGDGYRASSEHIDLMRPDDQFSINAQKRERLEGHYDVIAHGVEESPGIPTTKIKLQTHGREATIDHRVLAKLLKNQKGYNGEKIRMLSCLSGNAPEALGQNLANKIKKEIQAPSDMIWAGPEGQLPISSGKTVRDLSGKNLPVPNRPYDGKWNTFEPQGNLKKAEDVHPPELERKLSKTEMAPSKLIPNDEILRAASPQEFIGGIAGYLGENYPLARPHKIKMIETESQIQKLHQTWKNRLESAGIDSETAAHLSLPKIGAKGTTYKGDIALMPETMKNIQSHRIEDRLVAMKTITHEWWHAMRSSESRFTPFEEGAADLFSEMVIHEKTGAKLDLNHSYDGLRKGVNLLKYELGDEWFFGSRSAPDATKYLRETLRKAGYSKEKIELVLRKDIDLDKASNDEIWLSRVEDLILTKKIKGE